MRYWLHHHGVPIGSVELERGELAIGDFEPVDAYQSIRGVIRDASAAIWSIGFLHHEGLQPRVSADFLGAAARISLELRDADGKLVPVDWINVIERPDANARPVVFARFRHAHAGVASALRPADRGERGYE